MSAQVRGVLETLPGLPADAESVSQLFSLSLKWKHLTASDSFCPLTLLLTWENP